MAPSWMTMLYIFQKPSCKIEMQQSFRDAEMRGRADRQKLGHALDDAEQDRDQIVVHRREGRKVEAGG